MTTPDSRPERMSLDEVGGASEIRKGVCDGFPGKIWVRPGTDGRDDRFLTSPFCPDPW